MYDIPIEIKFEIFKFCNTLTIYNLMSVFKIFYNILYDDLFWKYLLHRDFDFDNIEFVSSMIKKIIQIFIKNVQNFVI